MVHCDYPVEIATFDVISNRGVAHLIRCMVLLVGGHGMNIHF